MFERCGAIIFVIDAQDDWNDAIAKFTQTAVRASTVNPSIRDLDSREKLLLNLDSPKLWAGIWRWTLEF